MEWVVSRSERPDGTEFDPLFALLQTVRATGSGGDDDDDEIECDASASSTISPSVAVDCSDADVGAARVDCSLVSAAAMPPMRCSSELGEATVQQDSHRILRLIE